MAPCYASIQPQGRYCLVPTIRPATSAFAIQKDGSLGEATATVQFSGSGPIPSVRKARMPDMVLPSPDGGFILAVDLGTDRLMAFRLDRERGTLSPRQSALDAAVLPGTGPRHLAFHPHQPLRLRHQRTPFRGHCFSLSVSGRARLRRYRPFPPCPTISQDRTRGAEIMVAPSGRFVYASNRGHDSLAIYAVDAR